jgi:hypothetical protein
MNFNLIFVSLSCISPSNITTLCVAGIFLSII